MLRTMGFLLMMTGLSVVNAGDGFSTERLAMVRAIQADVLDTQRFIGKSTLDVRVMDAMSTVPRHEFVPREYRSAAYENRPLPIGYGQTISQPYIVALMTDLLELTPEARVLEVGTGSGYQAAILATLGARVYTIEIVAPLADKATQVLRALRYEQITLRTGDGYYGWEEHAPFDAIVVTAAASHIPPPLIRQLKTGGRMVIPVGSRFLVQQLVLVTKEAEGVVRTQQLLPVAFVPLTGGH